MKRLLSRVLFTMLMALSCVALQAQIKGRVIDSDKNPLSGVSVSVKGKDLGTQTDEKGQFTLNVNEKVTLEFSLIGYAKITKVAEPGKEVNVELESSATSLDDVVVIGYQTVKRRDVTGSVTSVGARDMKDIPLSSAAEAITGRLAGVQVTTTEGTPGADIQIRVRGGGSITQDNSPLYIVDGVQVENALSFISPQEIENIDVLKDAASTAIYGARGANGVVIITTKGGKARPTQIGFNSFAGVRNIVQKLDVMNPYDYVKYQYQIYNFNTNELTRNSFRDRYGRWEDLDLYKDMPMTNWQDEVFGRSAFNNTNILSINGGDKKTTFNITLNHANEDGIMLNSGFKRTLAAIKLAHKATDRLSFDFSARYSRQEINGVGTSSTGTQGNNRLRNAVRFRPFVAPGFEDIEDDFDIEYANLTNLTSPVLLANQELRWDYKNDLILNGAATYEIIKGLKFKTVLGLTQTTRDTETFNGVVTSLARQNNNQPVARVENRRATSMTNTNTLTYTRNIFDNSRIDVLVGQETYQIDNYNQNTLIKWLPVDITPRQAFAGLQKAVPPTGMIQDAVTSSENGERLMSFFGRLNYSHNDKYIATFSVRRDGSSKFAPQLRNATFPSVQLAWRISEENFMAGFDLFSDLKLRATLGTAGNNRIPVDMWKTMFLTSANDGYAYYNSVTPGLVSTELANANLKWETTISRNIGIDFGLLGNRISGSIDVYHNTTKDLLLAKQISPTSGYNTQMQNIGRTTNRGIELQLSADIIRNNNFSWNSSFNIAFNRNRIEDLGNDVNGNKLNSYLLGSGWVNATYQDFLVSVGQPVGVFYGYVTDGFYTVDDFIYDPNANTWTLKDGIPSSRAIALGSNDPMPGDLKLKKMGKDNPNEITTEDRVILGNAQPKFIGGFNQQFSYKNFDMSIFVNFVYGNKVYNGNKIEFTSQYLYRDNNMLSSVANAWKWYDNNGQLVNDPAALSELNANTTMWSPPRGQYFLHSYAIEDGSFIRINNLTLGYSIPKRILQRTKIFSQFRVYATVNNLLTITGYSGYDPEANTRRATPLTPGVDYAAYPRSRYVLAGVNITF
ncbi:SusC/RagA family TonB-linked outer membrane protein [Gynurincola endophyticus]|uniref:SusC/RagA family TonB-linked outer membrane protein n=1 Tax=Gynurincola endophyticus TaxID=2479004 RepID=UPI000F8C5B49|nr:TonB-dependent receptor [Gynurincola endophyticus]